MSPIIYLDLSYAQSAFTFETREQHRETQKLTRRTKRQRLFRRLKIIAETKKNKEQKNLTIPKRAPVTNNCKTTSRDRLTLQPIKSRLNLAISLHEPDLERSTVYNFLLMMTSVQVVETSVTTTDNSLAIRPHEHM